MLVGATSITLVLAVCHDNCSFLRPEKTKTQGLPVDRPAAYQYYSTTFDAVATDDDGDDTTAEYKNTTHPIHIGICHVPKNMQQWESRGQKRKRRRARGRKTHRQQKNTSSFFQAYPLTTPTQTQETVFFVDSSIPPSVHRESPS